MSFRLPTARLLVRSWEERDREPFAAMGQDPEVMRFFPALLSRAQTDAMIDRQMERLREDGFCLFALERREDGAFLGFTGLARIRFEVHFAPAVEIGWRLARHAWGQGHATEAAAACLGWAFGPGGLQEIVSFAVPQNLRSQAVMERIGMAHDTGGDFEHPLIPEGSPLRRHVLYRVSRAAWMRQGMAGQTPPPPMGRGEGGGT